MSSIQSNIEQPPLPYPLVIESPNDRQWPEESQPIDMSWFCARYLAGDVCLREARDVSRQRLTLASACIARIDKTALQLAYQITRYHLAVCKVAKAKAISIELLQQINTTLLGDHKYAGQIRTKQSWVGGKSLDKAAYVPPNADQLPQLLQQVIDYCNTSAAEPTEIAANAYNQLIYIHPFYDGNGRTFRALMDGLLKKMNNGVYINPLMYRFRQARTMNVGTEQNDVKTIDFWQQALQWSMETAHNFNTILNEAKRQLQSRIGIHALTPAQQQLIKLLWQQPVVTHSLLQRQFSMPSLSCQQMLTRLCELKILVKHKLANPHNYVIYQCPDVFSCWAQMEQLLFDNKH